MDYLWTDITLINECVALSRRLLIEGFDLVEYQDEILPLLALVLDAANSNTQEKHLLTKFVQECRAMVEKNMILNTVERSHGSGVSMVGKKM